MEFKEMTLSDKIKVIAAKLDEKEFVEWTHNQVKGLAEHMQSMEIENPYETAKQFVFNEMHKALSAK